MVDKRFVRAAVLSGLLVSGAGVAAPADEAKKTVADLAEVNQETIWYQAQTLRAKARKEYLDSSQIQDRTMEGAPEARGIQGVGDKLRAEFVYTSGAVTYAKAGDTLPDGYKVERMSVQEIVISKNGVRKILSLGGGETTVAPQTPSAEPPRPIVAPGFSAPSPISQPR
jgi:hypothetical protein